MVKWSQVYSKVASVRHRFDTVAHTMVQNCSSPKDDAPIEIVDALIEEMEGELMELLTWKENLS